MPTKSRLNIFEAGLVILTLLSVIGLGFYFYDTFSGATEGSPFDKYNNNPGIIKISVTSLIARIIFIALFFILLTERYFESILLKSIYLFSALLIGFLQWYELYYGSTFYYGEVRDKQGLMFPFFASLLATLVIWKINYSKADAQDFTIKLILTGLVNVGLYVLWTQVYEPWNLWQS